MDDMIIQAIQSEGINVDGIKAIRFHADGGDGLDLYRVEWHDGTTRLVAVLLDWRANRREIAVMGEGDDHPRMLLVRAWGADNMLYA